jgi:hypothetical protein
VSHQPSFIRVTWVDSVAREPSPVDVRAFAIDMPRTGQRVPGAGFELAGWVIGLDAPVRALRLMGKLPADRVVPLDARRPDVAADYPDVAYAAASGFSTWVSLGTTDGDWRITVRAILANGEETALAHLSGQAMSERRRASLGHRLVTAPDFVIVGAQRGGTTSLYRYLTDHPQIAPAATKELHFLTDRFQRGRDWYLGQFPVELPAGHITGEATPYALFHPLAPSRLRALAPQCRIVVLLRDPVARAYSHFLLERSRGDETLDFVAALDAEADRLRGEEARLASDPSAASASHNHASYVARGEYAIQLERWLGAFPRDQIHIIRSEDLYESPGETVAVVEQFLGLKPGPGRSFAAHNQGCGPPLDPIVRDRLARHFAPHNARLAELLGWDHVWE